MPDYYAPNAVAPPATAPAATGRPSPPTAPPMPRFGIDPPRPAKDGLEWVWFPGGYWAEREHVERPSSPLGRGFRWHKRSNRGNSSTSRDTESSSALASSPRSQFEVLAGGRAPMPSPYLTEADHVLSLQQPSPPRRDESGDSRKNSDRSWAMGKPVSYFSQPLSGSPLSTDSKTSEFVESSDETTKPTTANPHSKPVSAKGSRKRTHMISLPLSIKPMKSSFMGLLPRYHKQSKPKEPMVKPGESRKPSPEGPANHPPPENDSVAPLTRISSMLRDEYRHSSGGSIRPRPRKLFGLSPWHRNTSRESSISVSSSIRDMLRGRTPDSPPLSDKTDKSSNGTSTYEYNELFPGGEARRIKTPPLHTRIQKTSPHDLSHNAAQHNVDGRYTIPSTTSSNRPAPPPPMPLWHSETFAHSRTTSSQLPSMTPAPPLAPGAPGFGGLPRAKTQRGQHGRWEIPLAVTRWEDLAPATRPLRSFEFDLPEHLPSSPMCPANKKHRGGGTGVCVYHGRRKRSSPASTDSPATPTPPATARVPGVVGEDEEDDNGDGETGSNGDLRTRTPRPNTHSSRKLESILGPVKLKEEGD